MTIIHVTEADIARGQRLSRESCPIALALQRETGEEWTVDSREYACRWTPYSRERFDLPDAATSAVDDYDNGAGMEAFEFELPSAAE